MIVSKRSLNIEPQTIYGKIDLDILKGELRFSDERLWSVFELK